jgi:hypothetical protein
MTALGANRWCALLDQDPENLTQVDFQNHKIIIILVLHYTAGCGNV